MTRTILRRQWVASRVAAGAALSLGCLGLTVATLAPGEVAVAAPSQDDIDKAKAEERYAELSVAQIELELAAASARAQDAQIEAEIAAEQLNAARERLEQAVETAKTARDEADSAEEAFEEGLKELASIAQFTYRSGTGSLDALAPYLESDGLRTLEQKRSAVTQFGGAADTKMQQVAALRQVADILSDAADQAKKTETEAYEKVERQKAELEKQAATAQQVLSDTQATQAALIQELAVKRNTTAELESARLAEAQRVRDEEAAQQVTAPSSGGSNGSGSSGGATANTGGANSGGTGGGGGSGSGGSGPVSGGSNTGGSGSGGSGGGSGNTGGGSAPAPTPTPPPSSSSGTQAVVDYARAQIGAPYVWGGNGPGFDCSGLTYMAYRQVGITLPRTADGQYNAGRRVPLSEARAGDLVFWSSGGSIYHVALYSGNGRIISAHQPGTPLDEGPLYNTDRIMPYVVRIL